MIVKKLAEAGQIGARLAAPDLGLQEKAELQKRHDAFVGCTVFR